MDGRTDGRKNGRMEWWMDGWTGSSVICNKRNRELLASFARCKGKRDSDSSSSSYDEGPRDVNTTDRPIDGGPLRWAPQVGPSGGPLRWALMGWPRCSASINQRSLRSNYHCNDENDKAKRKYNQASK